MQVTQPARRNGWLALLAVLVLMLGLLVPVGRAGADAPFPKPTSVNAVAVSGSNGLKVTWTAPTVGATKPVAYRVYYGTSSSRTKASSAYVATNIAVIAGLSTSTYYYVWVEPWSKADATGVSTGAVSSSDRAKTSSYKYKAPVEIFAVNSTKTAIELAWRTVTGAPAYRLRATSTDGTRYQSTGSDGTAVFKGLKAATSYTFTVSVIQPATTSVPGEVKMSAESSKKAVRSTTSASNFDAPKDLKATDQDHSSITLTWTAPSQYDKVQHDIRVDYAEDQVMKDNPKSAYLNGASGAVLKSLSSNTNYYVRVVVVSKPDAAGNRVTLSDRTEAILAKTRSPKGFIAGKVAGVSSAVLRDYVVAAYSAKTGDVNQQISPNSSGDYKVELRPGDYYVQAIYLGTGNYNSLWARSGTNGARTRTDPAGAASKVTVAIGKTPVTAPTITVGQGGTIKGDIDCPGTGACSVDVAALSNWGGTTSVIGQTRSDDNGNYTITGLTTGDYRLRYNYTGVGFRIGEATGTVTGPGQTDVVDKTMSNRDFIRTYTMTMGGTKAVGKTLSVSSRAPLAAEYPTTRAFATYSWRINGEQKSTGSTFKPSSAYRGDYVSVRVTYYRFGFNTVVMTSKSYRIA